MNLEKIDKAYVSPLDRFLMGFDKTHEKTTSQIAEIAKHEKIAKLRDEALSSPVSGEIWVDF